MSYTSKEKYDAIMAIGQYGKAEISVSVYEDLEKFNLIIIVRHNDIISGATLTYSGAELFRRLKKSDDYAALIKNDFQTVFNGVVFFFHKTGTTNPFASYNISFNNNGTVKNFSMLKTHNAIWKIEHNVLPSWVQEMEMEFSEAIIHNEQSQQA
ncbi:hypothetical protein [Panacibacter microcysteis]|nr:hypothetical protein [Panacibacter microcysteis]